MRSEIKSGTFYSFGRGGPRGALQRFDQISDHFLLLVTFLVTNCAPEVRFGAFTPAASGEAAVAQVPILQAFLQLRKQKRPAANPGSGRKFTNSFRGLIDPRDRVNGICRFGDHFLLAGRGTLFATYAAIWAALGRSGDRHWLATVFDPAASRPCRALRASLSRRLTRSTTL